VPLAFRSSPSSADRGLGLANWISTGNQADIDVADAIAFYAGDPATKTIAVYMEDASRGLKLIQALELARQAGKPVVILKVGTTPKAARPRPGTPRRCMSKTGWLTTCSRNTACCGRVR
jgi:acyl-CoA synthetase (NDP forming)